MKAVIFNGPRSIELGERPDPKIQEPTDAVVRVVLGCVCGSDLWYYRGLSPHALGPIVLRWHLRQLPCGLAVKLSARRLVWKPWH